MLGNLGQNDRFFVRRSASFHKIEMDCENRMAVPILCPNQPIRSTEGRSVLRRAGLVTMAC